MTQAHVSAGPHACQSATKPVQPYWGWEALLVYTRNMAMLMMLSQQYEPLTFKHSLQIGQRLPRMEVQDAVADHPFVSMQDESKLTYRP